MTRLDLQFKRPHK